MTRDTLIIDLACNYIAAHVKRSNLSLWLVLKSQSKLEKKGAAEIEQLSIEKWKSAVCMPTHSSTL